MSKEQQIPGLWQEDRFSGHLLSIGWCGQQSCDAQECTVGGGREGGREGRKEERESRVYIMAVTKHQGVQCYLYLVFV